MLETQGHSRRVVHLPVYYDNPYQKLLMEAQRDHGWETIDGGGGGNFLRSVMLRWKPNILHLHWLHPYIVRPGRIATWQRGLRLLVELQLIRWSGIQIVWTVHNLQNHNCEHLDVECAISRRVAAKCSMIFAHSNFAAEAARSKFHIPASVPLSVIRHPYYHTPRIPECHSYGENSPYFEVGFFGRIERYKLVVELVEAFRDLDVGPMRLTIAGKTSDPDYASEIREAIGNDSRIKFENRFYEEVEIPDLMQGFDIVACPSTSILTSGSVVLAMSYGKPVIAPKDGGIPEEVGEAGILYDSDDSEGLKNALKQAVENRQTLSEMGQQATRRLVECSPHEVAGTITQFYETVLPKAPQA